MGARWAQERGDETWRASQVAGHKAGAEARSCSK